MSEPAGTPEKSTESGLFGKLSPWLAGLVGLIGLLTALLGGIPKLVQASKDAYCSVGSCNKPKVPLPYGKATCRVGFVWREAYTNDVVCVTPQTRDAVAKDIAAAMTRAKPDGTCDSGFVWRQARNADHVCVSPQTRSDTLADNGAASSRVQPP